MNEHLSTIRGEKIKMKHLLVILAFGFILLNGNIYAQKQAAATKFSSVYTSLNKGCKTIEGENGTDDAYDCRGVGGYRVAIWYSAASEIIALNPPDNGEHIMLDMHDIFSDYSKNKIEWRTANGKPFAVIFRVFKYGEEKAKETDYFGKKIGEELKVVGLRGFENIDFTVDAKTPDANLKARALADEAYAAKK
jgi:hypothetical protein